MSQNAEDCKAALAEMRRRLNEDPEANLVLKIDPWTFRGFYVMDMIQQRFVFYTEPIVVDGQHIRQDYIVFKTDEGKRVQVLYERELPAVDWDKTWILVEREAER